MKQGKSKLNITHFNTLLKPHLHSHFDAGDRFGGRKRQRRVLQEVIAIPRIPGADEDLKGHAALTTLGLQNVAYKAVNNTE